MSFMGTFSKFILIGNSCFLAMLLWRFVPVSESQSQSIQTNELVSTMLILGASAMVFNGLFLGIVTYRLLRKMPVGLPVWMIGLNLAFLFAQMFWLFNR